MCPRQRIPRVKVNSPDARTIVTWPGRPGHTLRTFQRCITMGDRNTRVKNIGTLFWCHSPYTMPRLSSPRPDVFYAYRVRGKEVFRVALTAMFTTNKNLNLSNIFVEIWLQEHACYMNVHTPFCMYFRITFISKASEQHYKNTLLNHLSPPPPFWVHGAENWCALSNLKCKDYIVVSRLVFWPATLCSVVQRLPSFGDMPPFAGQKNSFV